MLSAILFGSIGTLVDTSELQREAFNQAFQEHKLNWHWSRAHYITLLEKSGGRQRIVSYAQRKGDDVDATAVHRTKSRLFQKLMETTNLQPRSGVRSVVQSARQRGIKLALVTTTSEQNVDVMLKALAGKLDAQDFDLITNRSNVQRSKPDPEIYYFVLDVLSQQPDVCVAIEDNLGGLQAATAAGLKCIAFPGENTAAHSFKPAAIQTNALSPAQVWGLLDSAVSASAA